MTETVADFRLTLERETAGLTSLCQLWTSKLVSEKARISEEVEVSEISVTSVSLCLGAGQDQVRPGAGGAGHVGEVRPVLRPGGQLSVQAGREGDHVSGPPGLLGDDLFPGDLARLTSLLYHLSLKVEDVNRKFIELKKIEANDWKMEDTVVTHKPASGKKSTSRKRSSAKAVASSGLKALIASKRKCLVGSVTAIPAEKENISQPEMTETSPEKTFDGGFFTIKSPFSAETSESRLKTANNIRVTRSAGQRSIGEILKVKIFPSQEVTSSASLC